MILQLNAITGIIILLPIIYLFISIVFFTFFLRKYIKTKHKMFGFLTIFFLANLLQNIFQMGVVIVEDINLMKFTFIFQEIFNMLVLYSMVVLLEVFERDVSFSRRQSIMTILVFAAIGGMLSSPTFKIEEDLIFGIRFSENELIGLIQVIFYLTAGIWLSLMLYRNYKTAWSKKQKKIMGWLTGGIFFGTSFPFISYIAFIFLTSPTLLLIFILIFLLLSNLKIIFIGVAFLKASKEPWLLQRHRVHFLIVYSKEGIQLFSKVFNKSLSDDKTLLLAGGFSAITSIFKEITETTGGIKSILLEDKELRLINKKNFISAILVDYSTQASEIAHKHFTEEFEKMFKNDLEQFKGEVTTFEAAEIIVVKYFS